MKRVILLSAVLVAGVPSIAFAAEPPSSAQQSQQAQQLADEAYEAYQASDYARALQLYQDSYRTVPVADILFNIAKIYDTKLQDRRLALEYYRRYNASPDAKGDLVRQATTRITALGMESSTPAQQPDPANEKPAAPATPPSDPGAPWRVAGIITGLVGVVGVGVGVFEGLGAKSQHDTAVNAGCSKSTCPDEKGAQSERDASSAATISTIGFVAGGALMLGGAAMYFLAPAKPKDSADAITTTKVRLTPTVGPQAVGLTLTGQLF